MARTAPVPNIPAIPGMNPGIFVLGGGGDGGGSGTGDGKGKGKGQGAKGKNDGKDAKGGGKGAGNCGPGAGAGCSNPKHGNGGTHAGDPVDPVSGRVYTLPTVDLSLPGRLFLSIERSYSSASRDVDVGLGPGWSHSLSWRIEERRRTIVIHAPATSPTHAPKPETGAFAVLPCGRLTRHAWGYSIESEGRTLVFATTEESVYLLSHITDGYGNRIQLVYEQGVFTQVIDCAGRVVRVRRGPSGRIAAFEVKNAAAQGRWIAYRTYSHDEAGDLVAAVDALGFAERFAYDEDHQMIRREEPGGLVAEFRYDSSGRCVESFCRREGNDGLDDGVPELLADGRTRAIGFMHTRIDYLEDGSAEITTSRALRRVDGNAFDKADRLTFGGGVATYQYDPTGAITEYVDALRNPFHFERGRDGRVLSSVDALGGRISYDYDNDGHVREVTDALGQRSVFSRDAQGSVTSIDDDSGNVARLAYDAHGMLVMGVLPNGGVTRMEYDAMGNRVLVVEPDGQKRTIQRDYLGQILSFTDERGGVTSYSYDAAGQLLAVRSPGGGVTSYSYDPDGNLARITDGDGRATELRWGGLRVVTEVVRPDGSAVRYRYDREQELVRVVNEVGEDARFERSGEGRITREKTFDGRWFDYSYDEAGQLVRVRGDLRDVEMKYDALGRLVERKSDGSTVKWEYDPLSRLVAVTAGDVTCAFDRDARGHVVRERVTRGKEAYENVFERDALGRVTRRTGPGFDIAIKRDVVGRAIEIDYGDVAPLRYRHDAAGYEVEQILPEGGRVLAEMSPDAFLSRMIVLRAGARAVPPNEPDWVGAIAPDASLLRTYSWSATGKLQAMDDATRADKVELTRDIRARVIEKRSKARTELYGYGPSSDLYEPSHPRTYDTGGRPTARGATMYDYDAAGRVIAKRTRNSKGDELRTTFDWNDDGLLRAVQTPDGARVSFEYDPFARRIEKRVTRDRATEVTRYFWDGDAIARSVREAAREGGDPIVEEQDWLYQPGSGFPIARRVTRDGRRGPVEHCVYSPNGFLEGMVSGDGANVTMMDPTLFGAVDEAVAGSWSLRAPGQYADEETGLYYNRHRYFDPETGAYLSPEPAGIAASLKVYAYADNHPLEWVDPTGTNPIQTVLTRQDGTEVNAFSGQSQGTGQPNYSPRPGANSQMLHPAVAAALPPSNARAPNVGGQPNACGEPLALSRHLYDWEQRNKGKRCNPPQAGWQDNLKNALGEIKSIKSKEDRGKGANLDACPNCGQTIPRLWALAGLPPPNGVYQGAGVQNPQNPTWNPAANQGQSPSTTVFNDANGAPIQPGAYTHNGTNWNPA